MKKILMLSISVLLVVLTACNNVETISRVEWTERNYETVELDNAERFAVSEEPDIEMLKAAMDRSCERLKNSISKFENGFPNTYGESNDYAVNERFNWVSGMRTGCYWLAYEYTGDEIFKEAAENMIKVYKEHSKTGEWLDDHDTGFIYSPSCVAGYKITGDESMKEAALDAADILYDHYDVDNKFVIRSGKRDVEKFNNYRTMVDTMMNIPLFFFAYEQTGDEKFYNAAVDHYHTTMAYLIRDDGSSYHHFQFDPKSGEPVGGLTWQGVSDDSCWSRGHSWLLYGFPIAYSYTKNEEIVPLHKNISNFYLNRLPSDYIPYWDLDFTEGSTEPRDSSAAAISTCGFLEMAKHTEDEAQKQIYENVAYSQLVSLIENCENQGGGDAIITHVTAALPQGLGVDESAVYADYFFMEALMRYINPDFRMYW